MAETPPLSPSTTAANVSRVEGWVQQLYESALPEYPDTISPPSTSENRPSQKRKRAISAPCTCTMSARNISPKRLRRDTDTEDRPTDNFSAASAASNASMLMLNERNTFSPAGSQSSTRSPRRPNSPSRNNITVLASATPPTIVGPSSGLKTPPPQRVNAVMEQLEIGLDRGWIPRALRQLIEEDADFGYQRIESHAWSDSTARTLPDQDVDSGNWEALTYVFKKVKEIWLNARLCEASGRDENAWCMDVFQPLMKLALKLEGKGKFWLQSVQSQAIATEYLSSVFDASGKPRLLDHKADFTLSFSHMASPGFEDLYDRLKSTSNYILSHTTDAFSSTTALFSCVEVKTASGALTEAQYQMAIWMASSLRKKMQLARRVGVVDRENLVEPCFAIVGHQTYVYLAHMALEGDTVHILGPEVGPLGSCETRTVSGIFRTLRLWRNAIRYGRGEGSDGFWGSFMKEVLEKLAGTVNEGHSAALASAE